jgi:hypothetical protein
METQEKDSMSTKQNTTKEDREFQIELLKIQIKYDSILTQHSQFLSIEVSTFVSLTLAYLTLGLTLGNQFYTLIAVISLISLIILTNLTRRYFESKKTEESIEKNLDKEFQSIRDKYIKPLETTKIEKGRRK